MIPTGPGSFRIQQAEKVLAEAQTNLASVMTEVRAACKHEVVGESSTTDDMIRYHRVCFECGLRVRASSGNFGVLGDRNTLAYKLTMQQIDRVARS